MDVLIVAAVLFGLGLAAVKLAGGKLPWLLGGFVAGRWSKRP